MRVPLARVHSIVGADVSGTVIREHRYKVLVSFCAGLFVLLASDGKSRTCRLEDVNSSVAPTK
jgi:hypothetical protein